MTTLLARLHSLSRIARHPATKPKPTCILSRATSTAAYTYTQAGTPPQTVLSSSSVVDIPTTPPSGSVIVHWKAVGVDAVDLATLSGMPSAVSFQPASLPAVPGSEGVGIVTAVASDVSSVQTGDHVIPIKPGVGTWRKAGTVSESDLMKVPSELRTELAATLPGSPCTAYRLLHDFGTLQEGDVVLQTAGDSAVGSALSQLGARKGLRVISIVDDTTNKSNDYAATVERLKLTGSEVAVGSSYLDSAGVQAVLSDLPAPKVAFHGGDAETSVKICKFLKAGCEVVSYCPGSVDVKMVKSCGMKVGEFSLADWLRGAEREEVERMVGDVIEEMKDGGLSGWLQRVAFGELRSAIEVGGVTRRKLVAMIEDEATSS